MSFIVKGINLPDKGDVICLEIYSDGSVWDKSNWEPHPPKASAIQIPKGHGDIKDVSEFIKAVDHAHDNVWNRDDLLDLNMRELLRDTKKRIEKLPTILEEEGEDG